MSRDEFRLKAKITKQDYIWNMTGSLAFAFSFPVLTILVTRILGAEQAGIFTIGFVTAQMFMIVGNYAVRAYQVSDTRSRYSFRDYCIHRYICCFLMVLCNLGYGILRGYQGETLYIVILLCFYKMIDALADVYEGELQRRGFLSRAGKSVFWRVFASVMVFSLLLLITKNMLLSILGMLALAIMLFFLFAVLPVRKQKGEKDVLSIKRALEIFSPCFPLFVALFLMGYINNSPKYAIEDVMSYEYQTYFNALYFPSQVIYMLTGFMFKPMLVGMAECWSLGQRQKIAHMVRKVLLLITFLVIAGMAAMYIAGIPVLNFVFGLKLGDYRWQAVSMIGAGGLIAVINFMYYVLTVMRRQKILILTYSVIFLLSLLLPELLVEAIGMWGACFSYLVLLLLLAVLLLISYFSLMRKIEQNGGQLDEKGTN